jgi:MoxR-like ATPase
MNEACEELKLALQRARQEIAKVIIGQTAIIDACLIAIVTGQHALIEGVPGVGKTLLVKTLAHVLGCEFNRIQFTPDLMPGDITGTNIFDMKKSEFHLLKGPIFTTFLLGDEINRAPAKTQSATLQAMQERKVSIDRETYPLNENFTFFATQNPQDHEGTYPLPEAQKDRFMFCLKMSPMDREQELELAERMLGGRQPEQVLDSGSVEVVLDLAKLKHLRAGLQSVDMKKEILAYIVDVVRETRQSDWVLVGGGPRATQCLVLASRVAAILDDRNFVIPEDIQALAPAVLEHRIVLKPEVEVEGIHAAEVIQRILKKIPVPR